MTKIRVSNLAERLGLDTREVIARLKDIGVDAKTATSLVDEDVAKKLSSSPAKESGTEEVRVTTNIIRRRAKASPVAEEPPAPAPVEVKEEKAPEVPVVEPASVMPEAPVVVEEAPKPEIKAAEPVVAEKPKPVEPEKPTPNQARILGMVDIPGVTSRPTRVVTKEAPVTPRRPAAPGSAPASAPRSGEQVQQRRPGPAGAAPEPDRARMKQVPVPPAAPAGDDRRKPGGGKGAYADKGGKKATPTAKRKEQPRKNELLEKRGERIFDPVYKGARKKGKGDRGIETRGKTTEITVPKAIKRIIKISETISVGELAKRMGIKATDLIKSLMKMGMMVTINHPLDYDTAAILTSEYGYEVENVAVDLEEIQESVPDAPESLEKRPPVVTIMGHVDHGKTSLLDAIREANVIAGEAGGITQHIGAYDVELNGSKITFLDTPGHEAFTAMRARGAKVTDIVVLVVAADDGVMPQTREAINHSKAAGVPIIVAINKVDKPDAKPERVKQELMEFGLVASEWGGDATMVEVSAKKRLNLEELLEMILLQADVMDLKANPNKLAKGTIVEAKLDKGRGPVATVLVQEGTLKNGDYCVVGIHSGRVRAMQNDRAEKVLEAGPSMPVEVIGLSGVPDAGDVFVSMKDEKQAKEIATLRQIKQREVELAKHAKITLEDLYKQIQSGEVKDLNVIIKGDVQGSVEAVGESLRKLSTDAVRLNVIHSGVGAITETDVNLAAASNTIIIGFSVRPEVKAQALAEKEGVDIRLYSIIYDAVEDVKKAMEGLLAPTLKEKYLGRAEIREVFSVPKVGNIAGCYVQDGKVLRNAQARLLRDNVVVYEGKLSSLRRIKDDVKEVASGYECGIGLENYNDIKIGDLIEVFEIEKVAAKL
ncbi:translation initiation factor IF-2 [Geobacter sp. SVR]|uniref:translation initiation factor IF-2 n=1 Tax=Geobacter sp. SVR TaxID=2495594 RepID=UPI00143EF647|nr:translation initiation factor IF-2 [Geobacter sp. SVR]BCS53443.1 translation initiation factor IF-2 [Geobacter sp. SVR]GCF85430.1 translation initiation factor IF-2 [Geobacter sp. SVR]